jgi:hypothetical protein
LKKKKKKFFSRVCSGSVHRALRTPATPISKEQPFEARNYQTRNMNQM